jgi:hypothetical protein
MHILRKTGKITGIILGMLILAALISHTALDIYVRMAFRKDMQRIEKMGEPVTFDGIARADIPDRENAAILYQRVFSLIDASGDEFSALGEAEVTSDPAEWTEEQKENIPVILAKNNEVFEILHEASLKPHCNFDLNYDDPDYMFQHPPYGKSKSGIWRGSSLARLLSIKSALDNEAGQIDVAVQRVSDGLAASRIHEGSMNLVGAMFGVACDTITLNRLERILTNSEVSWQSYQRLYDLLRRRRQIQPSELLNGFLGERCYQIMTFRNPLISSNSLPSKYRAHWPLLTFTRLNLMRAVRNMTDFIEEAKKPFREMTLIRIPYWWRFYLKGLENDARLGTAELAIALRMYKSRNGDYPESLSQLVPDIVQELPVDPFTGEGFVYHKGGRGFTIYRPGRNGKNEFGMQTEDKGSGGGGMVWHFSL